MLIDGITIVVYDCVDDNEIADDMGRWGDGIDVGIVSIVFWLFLYAAAEVNTWANWVNTKQTLHHYNYDMLYIYTSCIITLPLI